jgi:hypothetical protein
MHGEPPNKRKRKDPDPTITVGTMTTMTTFLLLESYSLVAIRSENESERVPLDRS